jgi:hypothetical protein
LVEVSEVRNDDNQEIFTLLFRAPVGTSAGPNSYTLHHKLMGNMNIFITPIKADKEGVYFEAVFNRLKNFKM